MTVVDGISLACMVVTVLSINIWPWVIYGKLGQLGARVEYLQASVDAMDELLSGDPPDDPGDGEDEPAEPSNVVAIGKRAA